jgi:hypothetical protein
VFLERKLKRAGVVRKRRVPIPPSDLGYLNVEANGVPWPGSWFHHRVALRGLRPVVRMSYFRLARFGQATEGPFRVTLDRELRVQPVEAFSVPAPIAGPDLLEDRGIMEVKFATTLPAQIKELVEQLGLGAGPLSKYRLGVRACGLVVEPAISSEGDPGIAPFHV